MSDSDRSVAKLLDSIDQSALEEVVAVLEEAFPWPRVTAGELDRLLTENGRIDIAKKVAKAELVRDLRTSLNNRKGA